MGIPAIKNCKGAGNCSLRSHFTSVIPSILLKCLSGTNDASDTVLFWHCNWATECRATSWGKASNASSKSTETRDTPTPWQRRQVSSKVYITFIARDTEAAAGNQCSCCSEWEHAEEGSSSGRQQVRLANLAKPTYQNPHVLWEVQNMYFTP